LGVLTFVVIANAIGGSGSLVENIQRASQAVSDTQLARDKIPKPVFFSFLLIPLSVGMFPHMFMHWLTARRARSFGLPLVAYPICVAVVWIPSVLLGVVGTADPDIPLLEGAAASSVLVRLIHLHTPEVIAGFLAAGVFAAIMSSLDSQVLSLSAMFTQDIVRPYGFRGELPEGRQVLYSRLFMAAFLATAFAASQVTNRSIFDLGVWSLSGYAGLFPLVVAALYWRRATAAGALAAVVVMAVTWFALFYRGLLGPLSRGEALDGDPLIFGLMPVAINLAATAVTLVVVSLLTAPPERRIVERFFLEAK